MGDRYVAYMLRFWEVGEGECALWRASLEDAHTGKLCAFADMKALISFLEARLQERDRAEPKPDETGVQG